MKENIKYDVVIIGGGISGLTAAYNLKKQDNNIKIAIIEASDKLGGRLQHVEEKVIDNKTDIWDVGGQWISFNQSYILDIIKNFNLPIYRQYTSGNKILSLNNNIIKYSNRIPFINIKSSIEFFNIMNEFNDYAYNLNIDNPSFNNKLFNTFSVYDYMKHKNKTENAVRFVDLLIHTLFGCSSQDISFLYFILFIATAEGLENLINSDEKSAQGIKIVNGTKSIIDSFINFFADNNVNILFNSTIKYIDQYEDFAILNINNEIITTDYIICALSIPLLKNIIISPSLSYEKLEISNNMKAGNMLKIIILYESPFWRDNNMSGEINNVDFIIDIDNNNNSPICLTYDATTFNNSYALVIFIAGKSKIEFLKNDKIKRCNIIIDSLNKFLNTDKASLYTSYIEKDWDNEKYIKGSPVCYVSPTENMKFYSSLKKSENKLIFAGTETASHYMGYMNGAVQSGQRAAVEVLIKMKKKINNDLLTHHIYNFKQSNIFVKYIFSFLNYIFNFF